MLISEQKYVNSVILRWAIKPHIGHKNIWLSYCYINIYIWTYILQWKLQLSESTKRNDWLSLRDISSYRATNSEECDVVWRNRYFIFLHVSPLLQKPWCTMLERGDATRPAVVTSEPQLAVWHVRARWCHTASCGYLRTTAGRVAW